MGIREELQESLIQPNFKVKLSDDQENAVELMLEDDKVASTTGGAGTGKTTILREVYRKFKSSGKSVTLAAPTGRAAKRIQEATGIKAQTIHRLLEFPAPVEVAESKGKLKFGNPKRNAFNPFDYDVILIDEASMISSELWRYICAATKSTGKIRLFGDINQLPPIDKEIKSGDSIFKRQLEEKPSYYLTYNFRSDDGLIDSANRILRGSIPIRSDQFDVLISSDPLGALKKNISSDYASTAYQVLCPMRKGGVGSAKLSGILRTKFGLTTKNRKLALDRLSDYEDKITVFEGDKIIWTKNDYGLNIMNGELGIIDEIDEDEGSIDIIFDDDRHVHVPPRLKGMYGVFYDPRKQIDRAYVMTTHKSQGSEFDEVIYFMTRSHAYMLNRNNFYTGVTRAKKKVTVICDKYALGYSMRKPRQ